MHKKVRQDSMWKDNIIGTFQLSIHREKNKQSLHRYFTRHDILLTMWQLLTIQGEG